MKVMLTPPDLWGSTGYVSQGDTGAPGATHTMYQVHRGHRSANCQQMPMPQVRHSSEDESKETVAENIILINRQRQVMGFGISVCSADPTLNNSRELSLLYSVKSLIY